MHNLVQAYRDVREFWEEIQQRLPLQRANAHYFLAEEHVELSMADSPLAAVDAYVDMAYYSLGIVMKLNMENEAHRIPCSLPQALGGLREGLNNELNLLAANSALTIYFLCAEATASYGANFEVAWREVHKTNMKKEHDATNGMRGCIKPPGWEPPNLLVAFR